MIEDPTMPAETHQSLLRRGETTSQLLANEVAELSPLRGLWTLLCMVGGILGWVSLLAAVVLLSFAVEQLRAGG